MYAPRLNNIGTHTQDLLNQYHEAMQVVQRVETLHQSLKEKLHSALKRLGETVRLVLNEVCAQDSHKAFTVYWGPEEKGTKGVRGALRKLMLVCVRRNLDLAAHTRCDARAHAHNNALSMLFEHV